MKVKWEQEKNYFYTNSETWRKFQIKMRFLYQIGIPFSLMCIWLVNASNAFDNKTLNATGFERNGKFLFDTLFGLTPANDEDDDDDASNDVKACNCGKCGKT